MNTLNLQGKGTNKVTSLTNCYHIFLLLSSLHHKMECHLCLPHVSDANDGAGMRGLWSVGWTRVSWELNPNKQQQSSWLGPIIPCLSLEGKPITPSLQTHLIGYKTHLQVSHINVTNWTKGWSHVYDYWQVTSILTTELYIKELSIFFVILYVQVLPQAMNFRKFIASSRTTFLALAPATTKKQQGVIINLY